MQHKVFFLLVVSCLVPALTFGAGKISGKVTDAGTGEALVGANVIVVGTTSGAVTNPKGEFVILNLPAGKYELKGSYIGYQAVTVSNVEVNNDLTTTQDFKLPAEGVTVGTIVITAERPMVNKSATNAVRIVDNDFFTNLPARGIDAAITLQPGVVTFGTNAAGDPAIYIRGGRADEVGYQVEGTNVADVLFGGRSLNVTAEAVEQLQVQAGGYTAEYGGANAGLVSTQFRTGNPDRWKATLLTETDRYTQPGDFAVGGYSYGYSDYTLTLGGPAPILENKLRLFGSVENTFYRDPTVSVHAPYNFSGPNAIVTDPVFSAAHPTTSAPDTINLVLPGGNALGTMDNRWIATGTALLDLNPVQVRLAGSFSYDRNRFDNNVTGSTVTNLLDLARLPLAITRNGFLNARVSQVVTPTIFYDANFSYYANSYRTMDPLLGDNVFAYGSPTANAALGYPLYFDASTQHYANFPQYTLWGGGVPDINVLDQSGAEIANYEKRKEQSLGGRLDLTDQAGQHELKFGGEYTRYTVRRYRPTALSSASPGGFGFWQLSQTYANDPTKLATAIAEEGSYGTDAYGYDVFGNQTDDEILTPDGAVLSFGPMHPVFGGAYVQDKIELSDIILNLGLRYDYINPDSWQVTDPTNLQFNPDKLLYANQLSKTSVTSQISPRLGFSFPASDRTVFHAQYGKFIQQTKMRDSYLGAAAIAEEVNGGRFVGTVAWGWGLKPTRTTQYEVGFTQQVSDFASFDISAFYKDIMDQVTVTQIYPSTQNGKPYFELVNGDFATSKGLEFKVTLRRTHRLSAQFNYTFSDTRATGSNTASAAGAWSAGSQVALPAYLFPADFNFANVGNAMLDYRFAKGDGGSVLEQMGLNLLFTFNSGHSFTLLNAAEAGPAPTDPRFRTPLEPIGSSTTPWFFQLDARLDKTFPIEGLVDLNVYLYVINVLGTNNATGAFFRTGDPNDDGWLSTAGGQSAAAQYGQQYVDFYRAVALGDNSGNFGPPRQIRFGLKLEY